MKILSNKLKLFVVALLMSILVIPAICTTSINVNASGRVDVINGGLVDEKETPSGNNAVDDLLPSVTMDEAINHLEGKVFDVVKLLQVIGKPFCIVAFIICAILTLLGTFGKSGYVLQGLVGMILCGIAYTCILFSPQIVGFFSTWLAT